MIFIQSSDHLECDINRNVKVYYNPDVMFIISLMALSPGYSVAQYHRRLKLLIITIYLYIY